MFIMTNEPRSLFPISLTKPEEKCLLPAAETVNVDERWSGATGSGTSETDLNWLSNKSFTSTVVSDFQKNDQSDGSPKVTGDDKAEKEIKKEGDQNQHSGFGNSEDEDGKKKKKKAKKSKSKKKKKERKRSHSPSLEFPTDFKRSKIDDIADVAPGKIFLEDIPELLSHRAWKLDRKKDKLLWTYESLPQQNIPNYRLSWRQCLGCTDYRKLKLQNLTEKLRSSRYYQKTERKKLKLCGAKILSKTTFDKNVEHSYLPIAQDVSSENLPVTTCSQDSVPIQTEEKLTVSEGNTNLWDENTERIAYYNKRLQLEPGNIDLWLEFIHFQDKLFSDENSRNESASSLAAIEKKLSILEKALKMNPSSLKLKFAQLEIGKTVWDEKTVGKEWETLINRDPSNFTVWKHYLLRKQCELSKFQVSEVISMYNQCFQAIGKGRYETCNDGQNQHKDFIELFHQYLSYLNQTGHIEKAVASFQAVMEFNLFCPEEYKNCDVSTRIRYFEDFWNSMVPRYGEDNAKGWKYWCSNQQQQSVPENTETNDKEEETVIKSEEKCKAWFKIETLRESQNWLPWRPDIGKGETEDNCQDLDSLVLFDDISFVLFIIEDKQVLLQLMLTFFDVMGLVSMWQKDLLGVPLPFLQTSLEIQQYGLYDLNQLNVLAELNISTQNRKNSASLLHITSNALETALEFFASSEYPRTIMILLWIHIKILETDKASGGKNLKSQSKVLKKSMKSILKEDQNRNNLIIWNAYVQVLQMLGKHDEALHTVELALTMNAKSSKSTDLENYGCLLLCQTYCQLLLNECKTESSPSNLNKISNCLKCISENIQYDVTNIKSLSSTEVLKIKRNFQAMIKNYFVLLKLKFDEVKCFATVTLINCSAIFDYVTSGLKTAMLVFDNAIKDSDSLKFCEVLKENVFCTMLNMIKFHMTKSTLSLELLRRTLTLALESFPNNVKFLKDFVELEERSNISCRRRRYFDASLKNLTSPTPVIFAAISEIKRQQQINQCDDVVKETGISNRIRSVFERGLQSSYCQHTPLIWRLYIHFEVKMNQIERSKGIFYRSLQQCPAVKMLYMDAIKLFGDEILQQMVDLMIEKEIRVHLPIEELDILVHSESLENNISDPMLL